LLERGKSLNFLKAIKEQTKIWIKVLNHKDTKDTKAWTCYLSLCQPVKKKSKRWIIDSAVQNEYLIHLFDFFFSSSGYRQAGYYFQAFVLFVSLWFKPLIQILVCAFYRSYSIS
jgi:hypothetical protein